MRQSQFFAMVFAASLVAVSFRPSSAAAATPACTAALYGSTFYDSTTQSMLLCNPSGWGGVGGWLTSSTAIYPSNTSLLVGIGMSSPTQALEVSDGKAFRLGAAYVSSGANYAHFANNAWYDGSTWRIPSSSRKSGLVQIAPDGDTLIHQTRTAGAADWTTTLHVSTAGIKPASQGIAVDGGCTGEGNFAYDAANHIPVYCSNTGKWTRMSGSTTVTGTPPGTPCTTGSYPNNSGTTMYHPTHYGGGRVCCGPGNGNGFSNAPWGAMHVYCEGY